jgi:hypothetical protein
MSKYGDPTQYFHHDDPMSRAAYNSIKPSKEILRAKVVGYIKAQGMFGSTCDELERELDLSHQTASARVTEAKIKGEIVDSGMKRATRSGRNAHVYVVQA